MSERTRTGSRILVVEDDPDVREVLIEILSDKGFVVAGASNGREALALLRSGAALPHVVLLDIMMPVMDGRQFRTEQLADPALRAIPVVVLSAHINVEEAAIEMGAAGYMKKPVQLSLLLATVRHFCS
jgi:CheY-like chemotaxis protein